MNLRELPRITVPTLPDPKDDDQELVNRQLVDTIKQLFGRDGDKEVRLRAIEDPRGGVSKTTVQEMIDNLPPGNHRHYRLYDSGLINPALWSDPAGNIEHVGDDFFPTNHQIKFRDALTFIRSNSSGRLDLYGTNVHVDGLCNLGSVANNPNPATQFICRISATGLVMYRTAAEVLADIGAAPIASAHPAVTLATNHGLNLAANQVLAMGTPDTLTAATTNAVSTTTHTHAVTGFALAGAAPAAHQLDGALHTVSGLTTGHFLKATGATTFGFAAHGLTYSDVGAAASAHTHAYMATPSGTLNTLAKFTGTGATIGNSFFLDNGTTAGIKYLNPEAGFLFTIDDNATASNYGLLVGGHELKTSGFDVLAVGNYTYLHGDGNSQVFGTFHTAATGTPYHQWRANFRKNDNSGPNYTAGQLKFVKVAAEDSCEFLLDLQNAGTRFTALSIAKTGNISLPANSQKIVFGLGAYSSIMDNGTNMVFTRETAGNFKFLNGAVAISNSAVNYGEISLYSAASSNSWIVENTGGFLNLKAYEFYFWNNAGTYKNLTIDSAGKTFVGPIALNYGQIAFLSEASTTSRIKENTGGFLNLDAFQIDLNAGASPALALRVNVGGNVSIGNTNNTYKLDVSGTVRANISDAATNTVVYPLRLDHNSSNTTDLNFGVGLQFAYRLYDAAVTVYAKTQVFGYGVMQNHTWNYDTAALQLTSELFYDDYYNVTSLDLHGPTSEGAAVNFFAGTKSIGIGYFNSLLNIGISNSADLIHLALGADSGGQNVTAYSPIFKLKDGTTHVPYYAVESDLFTHGMTTLRPTSTMVSLGMVYSGGGASITGLTYGGADTAVNILGVFGSGNAVSTSCINIKSGKRNGTGWQALADADTCLTMYNYATAYFTAMGNGNIRLSGDTVYTDAAKGIVLKDTQGTPHYWRVTISNLGILTTTDLGTTLP
jgi:hypothetical protein